MAAINTESLVECRLYKLAPLVFHSTIVVFGWEYSYSDEGLKRAEPSMEECQTYQVGSTAVTETEIDKFYNSIKGSWRRKHYDILQHNCQTFTSELSRFLGVMDVLRDVVEKYNKLAGCPVVKFSATLGHKKYNISTQGSGSSKGSDSSKGSGSFKGSASFKQ